jgi:hypothetical protein
MSQKAAEELISEDAREELISEEAVTPEEKLIDETKGSGRIDPRISSNSRRNTD